MPELRTNPLDGRIVVLAADRGARPGALADAPPDDVQDPAGCPFCPGNESMTAGELHRTMRGSRWINRTVANRYPAFVPFAADQLGHDAAVGLHDVGIVTNAHERSWAVLTDDEIEAFGAALDVRFRAHRAAGVRYSQLLVNHGRRAGASIAHAHAQLIGIPFVPPHVADERSRLSGNDCALCAHGAVNGSNDHHVGTVGRWVVSCPPWSATPYELLIAPVDHVACPEGLGPSGVVEMLAAVRSGVGALDDVLGNVAFNAVLHIAPWGAAPGSFHAHAHVWPALVNVSGFERGTGVFINVVDPAEAAGTLRLACRR